MEPGESSRFFQTVPAVRVPPPDGFFPKPIEPEKPLAAIAELLAGARSGAG